MKSLMAFGLILAAGPVAPETELSESDFRFDGPIGSQGATISKVGRSHFKVVLSHAPGHPGWSNHLQFQIVRNAKGNDLRVTAEFRGETSFAFSGNFHSWSYDRKDWRRIALSTETQKDANGTVTRTGDVRFPTFEKDTVWFGHQVPMAYEDLTELVERWGKDPSVKVHVVGRSLGGRDLYRLEITDPNGPDAAARRWIHYFANQHPGEYNSMWRMVGMIDWLLSPEGADARRRFICHFVLMQSPDGPSSGWHRVNAQGQDMNRAYCSKGANKGQAHEPYLWQKDLEGLMASDLAPTTIWSMHTWPGTVDPNMAPGPKSLDAILGPPERFGEILERYDPEHRLIRKLDVRDTKRPERERRWQPPAQVPESDAGGAAWNSGPRTQFGVTTFLCEGGGSLHTKRENLDSGVVILKSLAEYFRNVRSP